MRMDESHDSDQQAADQPLPESVSNQNGEEAEPGHGQGGAPGSEPGHSQGAVPGSEPGKDRERGGHGGQGEAGEGSQSTGSPHSAG